MLVAASAAFDGAVAATHVAAAVGPSRRCSAAGVTGAFTAKRTTGSAAKMDVTPTT